MSAGHSLADEQQRLEVGARLRIERTIVFNETARREHAARFHPSCRSVDTLIQYRECTGHQTLG